MSKSEAALDKKPMGRFLAKSLLILAIVIAIGAYLFDRYRIGIDTQVVRCLPWTIFIVDTQDTNIHSGAYFAYRAARMEPVVADGQWAAKQAAGVEGDHVSLSRTETLINGSVRENGKLYDIPSMELDYAALTRELIVPKGEIFGMGTLPTSYDSRYMGTIYQEQVIGRVYPLF